MESKTLLLMGMRRSGKSSICQVVFHNMKPLETLYLESTTKPTSEVFNSFRTFDLKEMPGQLEVYEYDANEVFSNVGAVIYVIDSQDDYIYSIPNLVDIVSSAYSVNPNVNIEVLMHKIDGLSDDFCIDCQRDIMQRINEEFQERGLNPAKVELHQTSIFGPSIYEAFSKIIQKLVPELPILENMVNMLCQRTKIDKTFLMDVNSKIYLATDVSPVDPQTYQLCSEFVDVAFDLDSLYDPNPDAKPTYFRAYSKLQDDLMVSVHEMVSGLVLVSMFRCHDVSKSSLVDYNVDMLRRGLVKLTETEKTAIGAIAQ